MGRVLRRVLNIPRRVAADQVAVITQGHAPCEFPLCLHHDMQRQAFGDD
ncbi:hypothetical protein SDC9_154519 [bioreactor metagenome]|uniref:Uncharacterized protein n=1 Tax=bioreactor metagenome TaxID=1076179 RepID=A0A645F3V4_9ZZZZ